MFVKNEGKYRFTLSHHNTYYMGLRMRKLTISIGENKGAFLLISAALILLYTDSTIPLLSKSKVSSH